MFRRRILDYCFLILVLSLFTWGGLLILGCNGSGRAVPNCSLAGDQEGVEPYGKAGIAFDISNTNVNSALYSVPRHAHTDDEENRPEYTWVVPAGEGEIFGPDPADPENRLLIKIYKDESRNRNVKLKAQYKTPNGRSREDYKTVRVMNW
jgi:hypothetical protein